MTHEDTPKLKIIAVGDIDENGAPCDGWIFDGEGHPNSVGQCIDLAKGIHLLGGYTFDELRQIKLAEIA